MKRIIPVLLALLLTGACERSEYTTRITGTLYTDSTLTTPVANDTVWFYDNTYHGNRQDSTFVQPPIGHALTDEEGRFGFLDWNVDVNSFAPRYERKFQFDYGEFIIIHWPDTLFRGEYSGKYNQLVLYPRKYKIQQY